MLTFVNSYIFFTYRVVSNQAILEGRGFKYHHNQPIIIYFYRLKFNKLKILRYEVSDWDHPNSINNEPGGWLWLHLYQTSNLESWIANRGGCVPWFSDFILKVFVPIINKKMLSSCSLKTGLIPLFLFLAWGRINRFAAQWTKVPFTMAPWLSRNSIAASAPHDTNRVFIFR